MKASFSSKAKKKMEQDAARGVWIGLIELPLIPAFAALISCRHGDLLQSPDVGESLVAYRDGITIRVLYDGRRTRCSRGVMALWHVFECFCLGRQI